MARTMGLLRSILEATLLLIASLSGWVVVGVMVYTTVSALLFLFLLMKKLEKMHNSSYQQCSIFTQTCILYAFLIRFKLFYSSIQIFVNFMYRPERAQCQSGFCKSFFELFNDQKALISGKRHQPPPPASPNETGPAVCL